MSTESMTSADSQTSITMDSTKSTEIDSKKHRFPFCIVWTPIPMITWLFPFIGHMGIATSRGVIRDFAGPYYVSENNMGFGWPIRYWQLSEKEVSGGAEVYDRAVRSSSDEYKTRMHNIFYDNCHSHVALALNTMKYCGKENWNMVNLCFWIFVRGKYLGLGAFLKQWLPCLVFWGFFIVMSYLMTSLSHH